MELTALGLTSVECCLMIGFPRKVSRAAIEVPRVSLSIVAGSSSMGGACPEHNDVLSASTTKLRTEVPHGDSNPGPNHAHSPVSSSQSAETRSSGKEKWEVEKCS